MKAKKVLKRISKIEALISEVTERSSSSAPHVQELLREAKTAISRVKKAVSLQASTGTEKTPPAKGGKHPSKATPEPSRTKRRLSAAGPRTISEATKKAAAKKAAPVKAAKAPIRKVAKKAPAKKAAVKAPSKKAVRVVQAAKTPAPPKADATTVTTLE